jgi:hypothetical protein
MRWNAKTRNRATFVGWSALMIAAAGVAWSLVLRELDGPAVPRTAEPDAPLPQKGDYLIQRPKPGAPLAHKGDYLIPRPEPSFDFAARWVPLAPAVTVGAGNLPDDRRPSAPPESPSSLVSEPARAKVTEHDQARMRLKRDACASRGMRREDTYRDNRWLSWRCVR